MFLFVENTVFHIRADVLITHYITHEGAFCCKITKKKLFFVFSWHKICYLQNNCITLQVKRKGLSQEIASQREPAKADTRYFLQ